ncbi:hypothetical protein H5410_056580 [Solanum commersonii]|uniref:Uncharacterized protein n=1 Tax=Solanum commersonii TaxID=4109 RepID=A0A9J5WNH3_SOLCO|nr:hypothetical protein H5410_056580 [Solanum commersonii]
MVAHYLNCLCRYCTDRNINFTKPTEIVGYKELHLLPLEFWIGRRRLSSRSLFEGKIIDYLRMKFVKTSSLNLSKDLVFDEEAGHLEWAIVILNWIKAIALSPDVTIDQLFDVPMCATSWKRSSEDYELIKFGVRLRVLRYRARLEPFNYT